MNISPIRTKADHKRAMARVSELMKMDPVPGTSESDELEVLAQIIEIYEKKNHDLGEPDPIDLILFVMEQRGLSKKDMVPFLGSPSRVSEVLSGKRPLTLPMIRNLYLEMGLPLEALVIGTARTLPRPTSVRPTPPKRKTPKSAPRQVRRLLKAQSA